MYTLGIREFWLDGPSLRSINREVERLKMFPVQWLRELSRRAASIKDQRLDYAFG